MWRAGAGRNSCFPFSAIPQRCPRAAAAVIDRMATTNKEAE